MIAILGSKSEEKITILRNALNGLHLDIEVEGVGVDSAVPGQPLDKEATRLGAINRAKSARAIRPKADFWFGLEGGLHDYGEGYHLVTYACLIEKGGEEFIGEGEEIHLPKEVSEKVKNGEWFGKVIREYAKEHKIDENLVNRKTPFTNAVQNSYAEYLKKFGNLDYRKKVSGIIVDGKDGFLIAQLTSYGEDDWNFVGGGVEEGEEEEEAILRELKEELGSSEFKIVGKSKITSQYEWPAFVIAKRLKAENRTWLGQKVRYFLVRYRGDKKKIRPVPTEIRKYKWVKYGDLESHLNFPGQWERAREAISDLLKT